MEKLENILLIEDDKVTNFINQRLIKKVNLSFKINVTHNGDEGLSYIKKCFAHNDSIPQLVLLDINMPVMDGFDFLEELEKLRIKEKLIIIILTTSGHTKDIDKLHGSGNSDIIAKPLTEQKFIKILDKFFDYREYGQTA